MFRYSTEKLMESLGSREYFLPGIVSRGNLAIEKNVGGLIKDESCIIAKSLLGLEDSYEHEDHAFLYVVVMWREFNWRESNRSEFVQVFHGKSDGISRITCTVSTG